MALTFGFDRSLAAKVAAMLRAFVHEEHGADLVEYAFLGAFVATAGYVVLNGLGDGVGTAYGRWIEPNTGAPSLWEPPPPTGP